MTAVRRPAIFRDELDAWPDDARVISLSIVDNSSSPGSRESVWKSVWIFISKFAAALAAKWMALTALGPSDDLSKRCTAIVPFAGGAASARNLSGYQAFYFNLSMRMRRIAGLRNGLFQRGMVAARIANLPIEADALQGFMVSGDAGSAARVMLGPAAKRAWSHVSPIGA